MCTAPENPIASAISRAGNAIYWHGIGGAIALPISMPAQLSLSFNGMPKGKKQGDLLGVGRACSSAAMKPIRVVVC
jgi:hypothetical protein